jgi:hypothetical protein
MHPDTDNDGGSVASEVNDPRTEIEIDWCVFKPFTNVFMLLTITTH